MRRFVCVNCGGNKSVQRNGYTYCTYCDTQYTMLAEELPYGSGITLKEDIMRLLRKCESDPANAKRYANRILDIDPTNIEARKYL